jgi:hypothetical protein
MRGLTWTVAGGVVARDDLLSSRSRVRVALGAPPRHRMPGRLRAQALMICTTRSAAFVPVACPMGQACGVLVRPR